MRTGDDDIRDHVTRSWAAWGRGDARGYAALFAPDIDYVAFDGSHAHGRAEVERSHAELFATVLRGTCLRGEITDVRRLGPDVALVHALGAAVWPWQRGLPPDRLSRQTYVLVRDGAGWTITAFHNTRVRPTPPPGSLGFKLFAWVVALRLRLHAG